MVATQKPRDLDRMSPPTAMPNRGRQLAKLVHVRVDISRPVVSIAAAIIMISP